MYDTNYNRKIQSQILDNTKRHMMNIKALNGSGMKKGLICENCGSVLTGGGHHHISFNDVMNDIKKVGDYIKPVAKPILNAFTNKAVESISNASPMMMAAGMHRFHKGSRSRTHHGELDFTTKKGDLVHHINGHYVRDGELPYGRHIRRTGAGLTERKGSGIKEFLMKEGKDLAKPVLKTVLHHYMDKAMNRGGSMEDTDRHMLRHAKNHEFAGGFAPRAVPPEIYASGGKIFSDKTKRTLKNVGIGLGTAAATAAALAGAYYGHKHLNKGKSGQAPYDNSHPDYKEYDYDEPQYHQSSHQSNHQSSHHHHKEHEKVRDAPPRGPRTDYDILGISPGASLAEIKKAYKKQSLKAHPDRGGSNEEFQELSNAYERLKGMHGGKVKRKSTKTSPWISHVKAYAKHHGMNYAEALRDPGCKNSYK